MKKFAVIVAAGAGTRMGRETPKQFMILAGKSVLSHSIDRFFEAFPDMQVILVIAAGQEQSVLHIVDSSKCPQQIMLVTGADTRLGSVIAGLQHVPDDAIVFVHDSVRCLLSASLIVRCYNAAVERGNAIPAITAVDSVRIVSNDGNHVIDRNSVKLIQTPQTFKAAILKEAYRLPGLNTMTDDASVAEKVGININIVEGERENIKITYPSDLATAEAILKNRTSSLL